MNKDSLGDRMKRYEVVNKDVVIPRMPTILRLDGKAFHTFTKQFTFPFSDTMHQFMQNTTSSLMHEVQNARLGYFQSDEISILLNDWGKHETQQWFGGEVQKMVSISAGVASSRFTLDYAMWLLGKGKTPAWEGMPVFDSRIFQVPLNEVTNYFIWRQQDASRNSVQMLGQSYFSHKQLHKKNNSNIQDMLMLEHGVNWNDLETRKRRGSCFVGKNYDGEIPLFTTLEGRNYVEKHLDSD